MGADRLGGFRRPRIGMHPHPAEIITEARLHESAGGWVERLAGRAQNIVDDGRGLRRHWAASRSPTAFALQHRARLALFFAFFGLARRIGGSAAGTFALQ